MSLDNILHGLAEFVLHAPFHAPDCCTFYGGVLRAFRSGGDPSGCRLSAVSARRKRPSAACAAMLYIWLTQATSSRNVSIARTVGYFPNLQTLKGSDLVGMSCLRMPISYRGTSPPNAFRACKLPWHAARLAPELLKVPCPSAHARLYAKYELTAMASPQSMEAPLTTRCRYIVIMG